MPNKGLLDRPVETVFVKPPQKEREKEIKAPKPKKKGRRTNKHKKRY